MPITINDQTTRILNHLAEGPRTLSQLEKALGVSKPMASKALSKLEKDGLISSQVRRTRSGREKVYRLKPFSLVLSFDEDGHGILSFRSDGPLSLRDPLLGQVRQKEYRDALRLYVEVVADRLKKRDYALVLFGSVARGEGTRKSDLDLAFISDSWDNEEKEEVRDLLAGVVHAAVVQSKPVFVALDALKKGEGIAKAIQAEGMVLLVRGPGAELWRMLKRYKNISL